MKKSSQANWPRYRRVKNREGIENIAHTLPFLKCVSICPKFIRRPERHFIMLALNISDIHQSTSIVLRSYVSEHGLHGTITFTKNGDEIFITTNLEATLEFPNSVWSWYITEFPVDYTGVENRYLKKATISFSVILTSFLVSQDVIEKKLGKT